MRNLKIECVYTIVWPSNIAANTSGLRAIALPVFSYRQAKITTEILSDTSMLLDNAALKTTRGPRWPCIAHLITRKVTSQLAFR